MPFDLLREIKCLANALQAAEIEYAICGGLAVAIHGYPRYTKDLDILAQESDLQQIEAIATQCGFTFSAGVIPFDVGKESERRIFRISKIDGEDILTLDVLIVTPVLEDIWNSRVTVASGDQSLQIISRKGLIEMKRLAGRPIDLADMENLKNDP